MMANSPPDLYALLVGINEYASPTISNLGGCVNDVNALEQLIHDQFKVPSENIHKLLNEQATHQAIKTAFREHLINHAHAWVQAGKKGTPPAFLFHYSGHGSRAKDENHIKPGGMDETIVPHDSRTEGIYDIKDWELGQLLDELTQYASDNVTVILDCCHSGSGTRGNKVAMVATRRCPPDERPQPTKNPFPIKPTRALSSPSGWMPTEKYVLLAGCRNTEEANEYWASEGNNDCQYGAMTYFLIKELAQLAPEQVITYRELHERVRYQVNNKYKEQMPQCEGDRDRQVLGGLRPAREVLLTVIDKSEGLIWVDGGIAHGLSEDGQLQVYPPETRTLKEAGEPIALLSVEEMGAIRSGCVVEEGNANIPIQARVVVYRMNHGNMQRSVLVDIADDTLRIALQARLTRSDVEPYVKLVEPDNVADFWIREIDNRLEIQDGTGGLLVAPFELNQLSELSQDLTHLIRYHNALNLSNTANHSELAGAISVTVKQLDFDPDTQQPIAKPIVPTTGGNLEIEAKQRIVLEITNHADVPLYFAILHFDYDWSISQLYPTKGRHEQLAVGHCFRHGLSRKRREQLTQILPPEVPEARNVVKVIATVDEADFDLLEQKALKTPFTPRRTTVYRGKKTSVLSQLMEQAMRGRKKRVLGPPPASAHDEWTTAQIDFRWVQPFQLASIEKGRITHLKQFEVTLETQSELKAKAGLSTMSQASRDVDHPIPPLLQNHPNVQPFALFATRNGVGPSLNVLELFEIEDHSTVTPEQPLIIKTNTSLAKNEHLLLFGYDGEFYVPLGKVSHRGSSTVTRGDSGTEIWLERLPEPTTAGTRDLKGALKIYFYKVVDQYIDADYHYPQLAVAAIDAQGEVAYTTDNVQARVNSVPEQGRILLYIHGIIGDTRLMAGSARPAWLKLSNRVPALSEHYDLILTFDYENINTPIEQTARDLKQRLTAVGLPPGHTKILHIVAHSMGGLVSRWFIEQEGGNQIVQHLVMLGTPNGGSPWTTIEDWALTTLTVGLNGLSLGIWPTYILTALLKAIETIDVTLDEMNPNSEFLDKLNKSSDPGIPYTIIAGNTAIIPNEMQESRWMRLWHKIKPKNFWYQTADLAFFGQPNDLAASVTSINNVPEDRNPNPIKLEHIPCDHVSYFSTEVGLQTLADSLIYPNNQKNRLNQF